MGGLSLCALITLPTTGWVLFAALAALDAPAEARWPLPKGIGRDMATAVLVATSGLLGAFLHGLTSFASYLGNGTFRRSWAMWYLCRGPIGAGSALIFYFLLRGGLMQLAGGGEGDQVDPYGVAAVSGLAGLFSKQALDKLRQVFDVLFTSQGDDARDDKLRGGTAG